MKEVIDISTGAVEVAERKKAEERIREQTQNNIKMSSSPCGTCRFSRLSSAPQGLFYLLTISLGQPIFTKQKDLTQEKA